MTEFQMGQHAEAIRLLQADMTDVKNDTRAIRILLAEQKGERRSMVKLGAVVGACAGSLVTFVAKLVLVKLGMA